MLVYDWKKQIHECMRVLQSGSYASFAIWGRKEQTFAFMVHTKAHAALGLDAPPMAPQFALTGKIDEVKEEFKNTGFVDYKQWYQTSNFHFKDAKEYLDVFHRPGGMTPPLLPEVYDKMIELYNEEKDELRMFETIIILVKKP